MNNLSFDNNFEGNSMIDEDVLSAFKQNSKRSMNIQHGMSAKEISDVVSEKIIAVVKEQFEATKVEFESKGRK
jgi:hypothetical protein